MRKMTLFGGLVFITCVGSRFGSLFYYARECLIICKTNVEELNNLGIKTYVGVLLKSFAHKKRDVHKNVILNGRLFLSSST